MTDATDVYFSASTGDDQRPPASVVSGAPGTSKTFYASEDTHD